MNNLYENKKVIVYGAGDYGQTLIEFLKIHNILKQKVLAIAVTKREQEQMIEGFSVCEISKLVEFREMQVIIAASEEKHTDMIKVLKELGFDNYCVMNEVHVQMMRCALRKEKEYIWTKKMLHRCVANSYEAKAQLIDLQYGQILNRVIEESKWLVKKDFAPGGMAVCNKYLYILYKILDSGKFSNLLDIGMGQTTKMMSQYANFNSNIKHLVIEDDESWINFFIPTLDINENVEIMQLDYIYEEVEDERVRVYSNFSGELQGRKFDLISIDAPLGGDMKTYSRIDILKIVPACLKESWIIMIDDLQRVGEENTYQELLKRLRSCDIPYETCKHYCGEKTFGMITSIDNRFFCKV